MIINQTIEILQNVLNKYLRFKESEDYIGELFQQQYVKYWHIVDNLQLMSI